MLSWHFPRHLFEMWYQHPFKTTLLLNSLLLNALNVLQSILDPLPCFFLSIVFPDVFLSKPIWFGVIRLQQFCFSVLWVSCGAMKALPLLRRSQVVNFPGQNWRVCAHNAAQWINALLCQCQLKLGWGWVSFLYLAATVSSMGDLSWSCTSCLNFSTSSLLHIIGRLRIVENGL